MENFFNQNISLSVLEFAFLIMIICLFLILISFFNNQKKIKLKLDDIQKSITKINSHINEISTEYGIIDKNLNSSKEDLTNINQTIRSIQKDIGKKNDENLSEQIINKAVDLAKLGVDVTEISNRTGLSEEQIETLIKFHTQK
jgi:septal ring factor EnvC (AmiA/AmiB activator)|tara:strand:+ start:536 stop:964 length:429 start_codon:yes stop_codon:yes gene_type:complete